MGSGLRVKVKDRIGEDDFLACFIFQHRRYN